jgi:chromosomal replication initiation ATPase DnaA
MSEKVWTTILLRLRATIEPDEYRRWFAASSQASDSGDQLTIWIPSAAEGRHISVHYLDRITRELKELGRTGVALRFIATGYGEEEDDDEER